MSTAPARAALPYAAALDGLRAVAVYLVLAYHAGVVVLRGGFVGVDLFFVLSGFLVTGVIWSEVAQRGTFSVGGFYARRVRRLLPAAVVVVVVTAAVQLLVAAQPTREAQVGDARAALLYVANWHFIGQSGDYFAQTDAPSPFLHFWSLSIEEQFYVVFPLAVLLVLRASRRPLRLLALVVGSVGAVSVGLQLWRAATDTGYAYYATETRVYQLAAGSALMLLVRWLAERDDRRWPDRAGRLAAPAAVAGLVVLVLVASRWLEVSPSTRGLLATVASVLVVGGVWLAPRGPLARLLALPLPRYLGQVSYATYLWHWPVLLVLMRVLDTDPWVVALLGAAVTTGLAALSGQVLETPLRRGRLLDGRRWPVVAGGLAVSAVVALVVVPPVLRADQRPAVAAEGSGAASDDPVLAGPVPDVDLVAAKADIGTITTDPCTLGDLTACTAVDGDGPHVLLMGDSQAVSFVPALVRLAEEHGLRLSTNVQTGCPWQAGQRNTRGDDEELQARCVEVRDRFLVDVLPRMDVDVVVAVGLSRSDPYWETRLEGTDAPPGETLDELQLRTTRATADAVLAAGSRLVIAHSVFGTEGWGLAGFDPLECLAAARTLGECAVVPPLIRPAVDDVYGVLDTEHDDVATIDLTDVVCPDRPLCHPVKRGLVVWKDRDHVTAGWFVARRAAIWRRLQATGLLG